MVVLLSIENLCLLALLLSDSEPLEESILVPAPDSYRPDNESGASSDEHESAFQSADASEV